jgi:hypothetical protein
MTGNHGDFSARSTGEPGRSGAADAPARSCYIAPPDLPEVLREQMSYLLAHDAHHAGHNAASCGECLRLAQLVRLLMQPFE